MKYTDLNIQFSIEHTTFSVLNLVYERFLRSIPSHSHSNNSYEIHYIPHGYGTVMINDTKYDITPNTLYVTGPNIIHSQEPNVNDPMVEYCIYVKAEFSKHLGPILSALKENPFWFGQDRQNLFSLVQQLFYELEAKPLGYKTQVELLLAQFIIKVVRNYTPIAKNNPHSLLQGQFERSNLYDQKYLILEECFLYEYQNISLPLLASRLGLSTRQTERLLKEHYGQTFLQKKQEARMSAAAILLKKGDATVTEISEQLGYSSVEHFSNAFKRYYKTPASKFRKSFKE